MLKHVILFSFFLFYFSCDSDNHIRTYQIRKKIPINQGPIHLETKNIKSSGFIWETPNSWVPNNNSSSMRIASYNVPFSKGVGDLSVMILNGKGGGIAANVNRWRGQIGMEPIMDKDIIKKAKLGESQLGSYFLFELMSQDKNDLSILAAIIPLSDNTLFIKLTIHKDGIKELKKEFNTFCSSFNYDENI